MNKKTHDRIRRVARTVRDWAEQYAADCSEWYYPEDLCGLCAIASARLHLALHRQKIRSTLVMSQNEFGAHVFCVVGDYVVDVTATQFHNDWHDRESRSIPRVLIRKQKSLRKHGWIWKTHKSFKSANALKMHQKRTGWGPEQTALCEKE